MKPGDLIPWLKVPPRAMVRIDTSNGRLYGLRLGRLGLLVGGPASWCGALDEQAWTWDLARDWPETTIVALDVDLTTPVEVLRAMAERFEADLLASGAQP